MKVNSDKKSSNGSSSLSSLSSFSSSSSSSSTTSLASLAASSLDGSLAPSSTRTSRLNNNNNNKISNSGSSIVQPRSSKGTSMCSSKNCSSSTQRLQSTLVRIVDLANELLSSTSSIRSSTISSLRQINSQFFIQIYESILECPLKNKIQPTTNVNDEIYNLKLIIHSLSNDILNEDLSHIDVEAFFAQKPDLLSIEYLLDIFKSLNEWLQDRMNSVSSSPASKANINKGISPIPTIAHNKHATISNSISTSSYGDLSLTALTSSTPSSSNGKNPNGAHRQSSKHQLESTSIRSVLTKPARTTSINRSTSSRRRSSSLVRFEHLLDEYSQSTSSSSLGQIRDRYSSRLSELDRNVEFHHKKIAEICEKQERLFTLLRRDLAETKRLEIAREKQRADVERKAREREKKIDLIRMQKFNENLQQIERSKRLREENEKYLKFKNNLENMVKSQNEHLNDFKRYAREKSAARIERQMDRLESMQNFYKFKFDCVAQKLQNEKREQLLREKSEAGLYSKMNRDLRTKLESELQHYQDMLLKSNYQF